MKRVSEGQVREEARRGKNEPMAKVAKVKEGQNGEVEPLRSTARKQPGTELVADNFLSDTTDFRPALSVL